MATYDGRAVCLYVDGVCSAPGYREIKSLTMNALAIGLNASDRTAGFNGWVDDVRVYNRVLNWPEIDELYGRSK